MVELREDFIKNSLVKDKKVFVYCQPKAWNNMTIMK